ncbi:MAG: ATP-dependent protease, partial [Synergistaceae bacterium]|nr:ATP-dependent protease [Synergistaceae bacterium]
KMTGPIHNKGLLILESFLGRKFARVFPLSLTARITFEQTYGGIEGDSASSTELYCILSALAEVPLKQGIAVTGSVDQHGNIQPIGGVNEKIEGFFEYCRLRGFTGDQGVIIPRQNVKNLMLSHEVIDAVMSGEFKIWAVSTIEEGISILTGEVPGEMDEKGEFTPRSIYSKVHSKLKDWYEKALKQKKHPGPGKKGKPEDRESAEVEDEAGK